MKQTITNLSLAYKSFYAESKYTARDTDKCFFVLAGKKGNSICFMCTITMSSIWPSSKGDWKPAVRVLPWFLPESAGTACYPSRQVLGSYLSEC